MGKQNENKILGMVPRALAVVVSLVIVYSVTAPFVAAAGAIEGGFKQGDLLPTVVIAAIRSK
ncbi:MAG: hypothetical protein ABI859_19610 [Pseudomonadota bacterium]